MKTTGQLRFDLVNAFFQSRAWLAVAALLPLGSLIHFLTQFPDGYHGEVSPSALDMLVFFLRGSEPFNEAVNGVFMLPINWLLIQIVLIFATGFYPAQELQKVGPNVIVLTGNSRLWWVSKCLCTTVVVACFYLYCVLIFFAYALISGSSFFELHINVAFFGQSVSLMPGSGFELFLVLVTPFAASLFLCLLQLFLSLALEPAVGLGLVVSYVVLSIYAHVPYLVGDFGMLVRNGSFLSGGISSAQILATEAALCMICVFFGGIYLSRKEFISKDTDQTRKAML